MLLAVTAPPAAPAASGRRHETVAEAQLLLARLGFLHEPPDGLLGPDTRDAIIRFQAANRLPIEPRVDDRLIGDLRHAARQNPPPAAAPAVTPPAAAQPPAENGRRRLPPGVTPPPIR